MSLFFSQIVLFEGTKQLIQDIEQMIGPKPNWFWYIWIFSWRFLTPITLLVIDC
jgi:hypothetical protein